MTNSKDDAPERIWIDTIDSRRIGHGAYDKPNQFGKSVEYVRADIANTRVRADAPVVDHNHLLGLYHRIFTMKSTGDPQHPLQGVIDYDAKVAFETALESAVAATQGEALATDALEDILEFPHTADADTLAAARVQLAALKLAVVGPSQSKGEGE